MSSGPGRKHGIALVNLTKHARSATICPNAVRDFLFAVITAGGILGRSSWALRAERTDRLMTVDAFVCTDAASKSPLRPHTFNARPGAS
jgi:hypothetical protein